jgi:tetratricopeptide (TPR) repeat protein
MEGSSLPESILDGHFDEFHNRLIPLIKGRDYAAAETLCKSYVELADQATDGEAAAMFLGFLATVLSMAGRSVEALEALERGERYVPTDPRRKINTAEFLIWSLARPEDGLEKLAEAEPFLQSFGDKTSWHNARGVAALALEREEEAIECMRALASPERLPTMRTYTSLAYQVDLALVSRLVDKRLAQAECIAYLEVAEAIGSGSDESPDKTALNTVRDLLRKARAGA